MLWVIEFILVGVALMWKVILCVEYVFDILFNLNVPNRAVRFVTSTSWSSFPSQNHIGMFGFDNSHTVRLLVAWVAVNASFRMLTGILSDYLRHSFARAGYFYFGIRLLSLSLCVIN
jgi:hypothetical protein